MEPLRAEVAKKRPTWMIAVTVVIGARALGDQGPITAAS